MSDLAATGCGNNDCGCGCGNNAGFFNGGDSCSIILVDSYLKLLWQWRLRLWQQRSQRFFQWLQLRLAASHHPSVLLLRQRKRMRMLLISNQSRKTPVNTDVF